MIFFFLSLLQPASLGDHSVVIQASCCPAYWISSFWIPACTFLGAFFQQMMISCRPCAAMYHLDAFTWEKFLGSPFAKMPKGWPVPVWSSGSQAELSEQQGSRGRQLQGEEEFWCKMAAQSIFSCCISLVLIPNLSGGAENLHNYFLKVDVKCLQIAKRFFCQLSYSCVGCCTEKVKSWDKAFPVLALRGLIFQGEVTRFSWDLKISWKIWLPESTSLRRSLGRNGKEAENTSCEVQM